MRTLPVALATHVTQGTTTLAHLLKITRVAPDSQVFAFTSADADVTISSVDYRSAPGIDISSIELTAGLAVDNLELSTLDDGTTFTRPDVLGGLWRNAAFIIGRYNVASPSDGVEWLMAGTLGEIKYLRDHLVIELRGLQQYLQQPIGDVTSPTCRARLGDARCTVALGPLTVSSTVITTVDNQNFTGNILGYATDYFAEGLLTWTSGLNTGLSQKVKTHTIGGILELSLPMFQTIAATDAFTITPGCRKRLAEDCFTKFNNVLNFQGEPHLPGQDTLTQFPR